MKIEQRVKDMTYEETIEELDGFFNLDFGKGTLKRCPDGMKCISRWSFNPWMFFMHLTLTLLTLGAWLVVMLGMEIAGRHTRKYVRVWVTEDENGVLVTLRGITSWVQATQSFLRRSDMRAVA